MTLNEDWLWKVAQRKRERRVKERSHKAPPIVVQDRQDENSARLRAAKRARADRFDKAIEAHVTFEKFVATIQDNEATFDAPIPGVLDVDLVELAEHLSMRELPDAVRFMAVEEVHAVVRRVNKRVHGKPDDEIPWCLPKGVEFTAQEFKRAIGMY